jgi:hypothetical protein
MRYTLATLLFITATAHAGEATHSFRSAVPAAGLKRLVVDIPAGEVRILNGPANTIELSGEVEHHCDGWRERERAQRIADAIDVQIVVNGNEAVVQRRFGADARGWRARNLTGYKIELTIPAGIDLEIGTHFGEVRLDGSFGDIDVDLRAGEVHIRTPRANIHELDASALVGEVHTNLGNRTISREGLFPGTTHYVAEGGKYSIRAHVTAGELHVHLTN